MASAADSNSENSIEFIGPAQTSFPSLLYLANFSLSNYWPDWKNYDHPSSYIISPTFSFKNPEKSDQDIGYLKGKAPKQSEDSKLNAVRRSIIDRLSDEAEHVVYEAIWCLVQEKVQAPFLAVRNFDLSSIKTYLDQIFPNLKPGISERYKTFIREFDFVLIGPKIGIILIEVKSSFFTQGKDFSSEYSHLPYHIRYGLDQLNSFDLGFFRECGNAIRVPERLKVRKVLFTPNLERPRFENWLHKLNDGAKIRVENLMGWNTPDGITHWFKDDMVNFGQAVLKPPLYSTLINFIEVENYLISPEIFEAYGAIIAGLASLVVLKQQPYHPELNPMKLMESAAVLETAELVDIQDPGKKSAAKRPTTDVNILESGKDKLLLLTPDQQKALAGPERQFLIGAAGTGKSVVMQVKALELLQAGKSLIVFSPGSYMAKYENLFRGHGFSQNFHIRNWSAFKFCMRPVLEYFEGVFKKLDETGDPIQQIWDSIETIDEAMKNLLVKQIFVWLPYFDAMFIDDACDEPSPSVRGEYQKSLNLSMAMMALAKSLLPQKMIWVAIDPYHHPMENDNGLYKRIVKKISQENPSGYFYSTPLRLVMRCSENVYRTAYNFEILPQLAVKPKIGHKIVGFVDGTVTLSFNSFNQKEEEILWQRTKRELDHLQKQGYNYTQSAVIVGACTRVEEEFLCDHFMEKCREHNIPAVRGYLAEDESFWKLMICTWSTVSSLEWPVIIFVTMMDKERQDAVDVAYQRYRACSRATMKIIMVTALYNVRPYSQEADVYSDANGSYNLVVHEATKSRNANSVNQ